MARQLASIVKIDSLSPIEGADRIEVAHIKGWQCVVQKGVYTPGDKAVYFEIDSVPPDEERYRFMWDRNKMGIARPPKYRVKTMKLRGTLSQGVLMPLSEFPEIKNDSWPVTIFEEGEDVTELLGIEKYEPPVPANSGDIAGAWNFPVPKTDETRIQSIPQILDEFKAVAWRATVKLDGTSCTVGVDRDGKFGIASRNWMISEGDNLYWRMLKHLDYPGSPVDHFILQGEMCGPGIQGNKLGLDKVTFFVFNVWSHETKDFVDDAEARKIAAACDVQFVPVAAEGFDLAREHSTVESLLALAEGKYEGTSNEREGIVIRPIYPRHSPQLGGKLSFKVISNRFLLKEKD